MSRREARKNDVHVNRDGNRKILYLWALLALVAVVAVNISDIKIIKKINIYK
jgi:hypothetical protein